MDAHDTGRVSELCHQIANDALEKARKAADERMWTSNEAKAAGILGYMQHHATIYAAILGSAK